MIIMPLPIPSPPVIVREERVVYRDRPASPADPQPSLIVVSRDYKPETITAAQGWCASA